jgi:excisionase family DNA binding protein
MNSIVIERAALSIEEAAEFLGLKKNYLYRLVYLKKIPYYKPTGGKLFFKKTELEEFIFRNHQCPSYEENHA